MVFEINDLKGFFILVLFAIPRVGSTNINCSGRAFHCVNSTHFMICVDLGGGVSTTIDDFVIPCPATTVCHENNIFECDFPDVTTPPLQVIGVSKQSDISEVTLVTNSLINTTPTSDINDVFKENFTATTLPIAEDVTPIVKLEILENIMNSVGVNSDNTTETSFNVTSNFIDSAIETVTDEQISDNILTTSATDNNYKNLRSDVETSTHGSVNTSSTDKSTFFETATSVIGLINLISTDPPSIVSIKPSYNVLTSLDISNDYRATTTEQYDAKEVENVIENLNKTTDITFTEKSVITTEVNKALVHTSILNDTSNLTITEQNEFDKSNTNKNLGNTKIIVPETTATYATPINIVHISEPIIVALNPQPTTDNNLVSLGPVDLISAKPKHNLPTTNDYIDTFYGDTVTSTTNQFNTNLETILSEKPVTAELMTTTPTAFTTLQSDIVTVEKVTETNKNILIPESMTVASMETSNNVVSITTEATMDFTTDTIATFETLNNSDSPVEKQTIVNQPIELILIPETMTVARMETSLSNNVVSITTEATMDFTTDTIATSETLNNSDSPVEKQIIVSQPIELILIPETMTVASMETSLSNNVVSITTEATMDFTTDTIATSETLNNSNSPVKKQTIVNQPIELISTDTPIVVTDTIYQIHGNLNKTLISTENISDIVSDKIPTPILLPPATTESPVIEKTTTEPLLSVFTRTVIEVKNELQVKSVPIIDNESYVKNVKNDTFLYNNDNTLNTTVETVLNASSLDMDGISTESTTGKYRTIDISTTESLQAVSTKHGSEAKNELKTTNVDGSNLSVNTTPASYKVTSDSVTNVTIKDLTLQTDIVTNPQASFTPNIAHKITHQTTEKVVTDSVNKITAHTNELKNLEIVTFPDNLNTDQLPITIQDVLRKTTSNLNNIEPAPFLSNFTEKIRPNNIIQYVKKNNVSTKAVNTQDVLLLSQESPAAHNVPGNTKNTLNISHTTRINVESEKVSEPGNKEFTTSYKIETTTAFPRSITNIENDGDVTTTTLPPQEVTSSSIDRIRLLNATSATAGIISGMVPFSDKSVEYVVSNPKDTDLNLPTLIDFAYLETTISQVDAVLNKTTTARPIIGNINDNTTTLPSPEAHTTKDENIVIVSVFNIVNSSGNVMPNKTLQLKSSYPSLLNDHIKSNESQASSGYVTATDNVPDNNSVHVNESAQKNPEIILSFAETKLMKSVLSTADTYTLPSTEINTGNKKYISTESLVPSTIEFKHINPTKTDYVTEKPNDYFSTEAMLSQSNKLSNVQADFLVSPLSSVSGTVVAPNGFTTSVYNKITTIEDNDAISTQTTPETVTDNNINMSTEIPRLTSKFANSQTEKYKTESLLPISELPVAQTTTEPTRTTNVFAQSTPIVQPGVKTIEKTQMTTESTYTTILAQSRPLAATGDTNQSVPGIQTTELAQYVTSTINNVIEVTAAQRTTRPTQTAFFAQTTPYDNTNQNGIKTTNLAQNMASKVNNNFPQSMPSLHMLQATASQMITQSTDTTLFAQTTPLSVTGTTNPGVLPRINTVDLPQNVMSKINDSIPKSMSSLPTSGVTISQITSEPTHAPTTFADTTPLAAPSTTDQNILQGVLIKDLPQFVTTTVTYNNPQSVTDIRAESVTDSLIAPDTMVETIKIVGDHVSGTHLGESIMSDVESITPTVINANDSIKSLTNHESIVVKATTYNYEQNTPSGKPVDNNKAEIVNHTESNWMPSDVNIESIKLKDSSINEDLKSSLLKSVLNVKNKTLVSDSAIISKIQPRAGISDDTFKYESTTVATYYNQAELGAPKNLTQSNTITTKENINTETDSSVNANVETIDVKKYQDSFDFKNISDSYSINNTKANITPHLSLQNSTINDELEKHLTSTNHTITAEVQSHLNESDKQSNKTSYELTLNVTTMHNPNLKSIKLNASSKDTTFITVPVSVFNCSNFTRGKYADKKDCRKFYTCIGSLEPILGTCPNNTVFSEINKQCTRNLSHCVRNNQFRCLFEGRFSDFFKDNIYYICVKNRINGFIRYKLQCQNNYHLNKDSVKCEKNEEISTQVSSVSETINDESTLKPKSEKIVSLDNFECEKEGKFPYIKDCSKYYVCTKIKSVYRRKIVKCASDEVFDKEKKKCVESDSGEC